MTRITLNSKVVVSPRTGPYENSLGGFGVVIKINDDNSFDCLFPAENRTEKHVPRNNITLCDWTSAQPRAIVPVERFQPIFSWSRDSVNANEEILISPNGNQNVLGDNSMETEVESELEMDPDSHTAEERYHAAYLYHVRQNGHPKPMSLRKIARRFSVDHSNLAKIIKGKRALENVGMIGRPPEIRKDLRVGFATAVAMRGKNGMPVDRVNLAVQVQKLNESTLRKPRGSKIPSDRTIRKFVKDVRMYDAKLKPSADNKSNANRPQQARDTLSLISNSFKMHDFSDISESCAAGNHKIPSILFTNWDQVGIVKYKDTAQLYLAYKDIKPEGNSSGEIDFHVTIMLGSNASGFLSPPFFVCSSPTGFPIADVNQSILRGLPSDSYVAWSKNGSFVGAESDNGPFNVQLEWMQWVEEKYRQFCGIAPGIRMFNLLDQFASHSDLESLEYATLNSQHIILMSSESTDHLQPNDTRFVNKVLQKTRRGLITDAKMTGDVIDRNLAMQLGYQAMLKIARSDIYAAYEEVGFVYEGPNHSVLSLNFEQVNAAVEKRKKNFKQLDEVSRVKARNSIRLQAKVLKDNGVVNENVTESMLDPTFHQFLETYVSDQKKAVEIKLAKRVKQKTFKNAKIATSKSEQERIKKARDEKKQNAIAKANKHAESERKKIDRIAMASLKERIKRKKDELKKILKVKKLRLSKSAGFNHPTIEQYLTSENPDLNSVIDLLTNKNKNT